MMNYHIYSRICLIGTRLMGIPGYMGHFLGNGFLLYKFDLLKGMWLWLMGTIMSFESISVVQIKMRVNLSVGPL